MLEQATRSVRLNGRTALWAAVVAVVVFLPIAMLQVDLALLLQCAIFALVLVASIALLMVAALPKPRRFCLSWLQILTLFLVVSAALCFFDWKSHSLIRDTARWFAYSQRYKASVLAQFPATKDDLKHVEWDSWGLIGMDTFVYLVFDPTDSLASVQGKEELRNVRGLPNSVARVRRMARQWYTVQLYTGHAWPD